MNLKLLTRDNTLEDVDANTEFAVTRAYYIVIDEDKGATWEVTLTTIDDNGDDEEVDHELPFSHQSGNDYYYSCNWRMMKKISTGETLTTDELEFEMRKIDVPFNISWQWGIKVAYSVFFHANSKYVWLSGDGYGSMSEPIYDIEDAVINSDINLVEHVANIHGWGGGRSNMPMLNVEGTDIFMTSDGTDGTNLRIADLTNYMTWFESNGLSYNDVGSISPFHNSWPDPSAEGPMIYHTYPTDGDWPADNWSRSYEMGNVVYKVGDMVYAYHSLMSGWGGELRLAVASFNVNDIIDSAQWPTVLTPSRENPGEGQRATIRCRHPVIINGNDKVYLYFIDRSYAEGLIYRIDDDPTLSKYKSGESTPIRTNHVVGHDTAGQCGEGLMWSQVGEKATLGEWLDTTSYEPYVQTDNYPNGDRSPTFVLTDVSDPENPKAINATWMKLFAEPPMERSPVEYNVNNVGHTGWTIYRTDGTSLQDDPMQGIEPTLSLENFRTYKFHNVSDPASGPHPFAIHTSIPSAGQTGSDNRVNDGNYQVTMDNQGAVSGETMTLKAGGLGFPHSTLYYVCENHSSMWGTLEMYPHPEDDPLHPDCDPNQSMGLDFCLGLWKRDTKSEARQMWYSESQELLCMVGAYSDEILYVDISDPRNPIPRYKQKLRQNFLIDHRLMVERLTGQGNLLFVMGGANTEEDYIRCYVINIEGLGETLRSGDYVVEYDDTNFASWNDQL